MKKVFLFIVLFFMCVGCTEKKAYQKIDGDSANELIEKGAVVLDVRSDVEYDQGHIKGSIQVPYYEVDTLNYSKNTKIIVYCKSGNRSKQAADLLIELGYKYVYDLGSKENFKGVLEK